MVWVPAAVPDVAVLTLPDSTWAQLGRPCSRRTGPCECISWETCMQVRKQQLELDMEQQTGSKLGKEYIKAIYYHPFYLTSMLSILCEMSDWITSGIKSWNQDCQEKYQQPHIYRWYCFMTESKERNYRASHWRWKSRVKKLAYYSGLKTHALKGHGTQSHHFMANRWGKNRNSDRFYFLWLQNHCRLWLQPLN